MTAKDAFAGSVIGLVASAAVMGTGALIHGWHPGPSAEYQVSSGLVGLLSGWSLAVGACVLLALARHSTAAFVVSVITVPLPLFFAIVYEMSRNSTSHNLIPFEVAFILAGSFAVHLPAIILRGVIAMWGSSKTPPA